MHKEQEIIEPIEHADLDAVEARAFMGSRKRHLPFSGTRNFRDLGGYHTLDGKCVRWRALYRSGSLHKLTDRDLTRLSGLDLEWIVDFRSSREKEREPDRLPVNLARRLVEIPILDSSTQIYQSSREEIVKILKNIDPFQSLAATNRELATCFTAEMRKFMELLLSSNGRPILFHCTAGKDRTGFAAAIALRILGVPQEVVMQDYLLTNRYFYRPHRWHLLLLRLWKGRQIAQVASGMMRAAPSYLGAAFQAIDQDHGSFENYVQQALGLNSRDVGRLKKLYLE